MCFQDSKKEWRKQGNKFWENLRLSEICVALYVFLFSFSFFRICAYLQIYILVNNPESVE